MPEREVPLKAEGTGLLLPLLLPPLCLFRAPAMTDCACAGWAGEGLGLGPEVEQLGITGLEDPGVRDDGPEGV